MAVRVKLLKQVLSLKKQGCSDQVCIQAILESCKTYDVPDTIAAFFAEQRRYMLHRYDRLEADYMGHLEACDKYNKKVAPTIPKETILQELYNHMQELYTSKDTVITGIDETHFDPLAAAIYVRVNEDRG